MIIQYITESRFRDAFHAEGVGNQFSYEGLSILFSMLDGMEETYDLDVVALCCNYAEYADGAEAEADGYEEEDSIGGDWDEGPIVVQVR